MDAQRTRQPHRAARHESGDVLPANERDVLAKTLPVELDQAGAMAGLFFDHVLEEFRGGGVLAAQPVGEVAVDASVLLFERDSQREDLALRQIFELFGHSRLTNVICYD